MTAFCFKTFYSDLKSPLFWQQCVQVMRLHAPIGWILLALPGFWGYAWACPYGSNQTLLWIILGAIWARSMGCFYNDWVDREVDGLVQRTQNRPLVASRPSYSLCIVMAGIFLLGVGFFTWLLPWSCTVLAMIGGVGTALYPWAKRFTHYPQFILALIFNLAVWMPPLIENTPIPKGLWLLYLYGIIWTLGYDTIYAFQDWKDDRSAGIGSIAVKLGPQMGWLFLGSLIVLRFSILGILAWFSGTWGLGCILSSSMYYVLWGCMLASQLWKWWVLDVASPESCGRFFRESYKEGYWTGLWLLLLATGIFG